MPTTTGRGRTPHRSRCPCRPRFGHIPTTSSPRGCGACSPTMTPSLHGGHGSSRSLRSLRSHCSPRRSARTVPEPCAFRDRTKSTVCSRVPAVSPGSLKMRSRPASGTSRRTRRHGSAGLSPVSSASPAPRRKPPCSFVPGAGAFPQARPRPHTSSSLRSPDSTTTT